MTVKEAYKKGLLIAGRRIKTNGNMQGAMGEELYATILYIESPHIIVKFDKNQGDFSIYPAWYINCGNTVATIKLLGCTISIIVLSRITNTIIKCSANGSIVYIKVSSNTTYTVGNSYTVYCLELGNNIYEEIVTS